VKEAGHISSKYFCKLQILYKDHLVEAPHAQPVPQRLPQLAQSHQTPQVSSLYDGFTDVHAVPLLQAHVQPFTHSTHAISALRLQAFKVVAAAPLVAQLASHQLLPFLCIFPSPANVHLT